MVVCVIIVKLGLVDVLFMQCGCENRLVVFYSSLMLVVFWCVLVRFIICERFFWYWLMLLVFGVRLILWKYQYGMFSLVKNLNVVFIFVLVVVSGEVVFYGNWWVFGLNGLCLVLQKVCQQYMVKCRCFCMVLLLMIWLVLQILKVSGLFEFLFLNGMWLMLGKYFLVLMKGCVFMVCVFVVVWGVVEELLVVLQWCDGIEMIEEVCVGLCIGIVVGWIWLCGQCGIDGDVVCGDVVD